MVENVNNIIVIEGLGGAGKTTTAKLLAERYGYSNFNTGTLFRASAAALLLENIDPQIINDYILESDYRIDTSNPLQPLVAVNGRDVSPLLQLPKVTRAASFIGGMQEASIKLESIFNTKLLQGNMVVEGKNLSERIGSIASHKFFLLATPEVRAYRKWAQAHQQGKTDYEMSQAKLDTYVNDNRDSKLLVVSDGTKLIDTTQKTPFQVLEAIAIHVGLS